MRRLNNNQKRKIRPRSAGAQLAIDTHGADKVPKNGSDDALHADHYATLTSEAFELITTVSGWETELSRIASSVVCVTAKENYTLEKLERQGAIGPEKYDAAGVTFVDPVPWARPSSMTEAPEQNAVTPRNQA